MAILYLGKWQESPLTPPFGLSVSPLSSAASLSTFDGNVHRLAKFLPDSVETYLREKP
jgi:hypothetical protein